MSRFRQAINGLIVPVAVIIVWQIAGSMPNMAGILPTPLAVLQGWHEWIFGQAGMGLNPYKGTWLSNVQYSAMRVVQGFLLAALIGVPLGLLIGWSKLIAQIMDPFIQSLRDRKSVV